MTSSPRPVESVNNTELYNRWAKVYDTDGNILQAIDDLLIPSLLAQTFSLLASSSPPRSASGINIIELGAGTGRNTAKLLLAPKSCPIRQITALDLSAGMLEVAQKRCHEISASSRDPTPPVRCLEFDALNPSKYPEVNEVEGNADLVVSTLVLEHLPVDVFFETVKSLLAPSGGYLLLTNMHAEMGRLGQAGFVDDETGQKIRGLSFAHEINEVVEEGKKWGFSVEGEVQERAVKEEDLNAVGVRGKKWVGYNVWFGCVMRLRAA